LNTRSGCILLSANFFSECLRQQFLGNQSEGKGLSKGFKPGYRLSGTIGKFLINNSRQLQYLLKEYSLI
jgi:hypothetical protein